MDEYRGLGVETPLVSALVRAGIRHGRAAAFERCLDDHPFAGISGTLLGSLVQGLLDEALRTTPPPESSSTTARAAAKPGTQDYFTFHKQRLARLAQAQ